MATALTFTELDGEWSGPRLRHSVSSDFAAEAEACLAGEGRQRDSLLSVRRLNLHDRASSDTDLAHSTLHSCSRLTVDRHEYQLGAGHTLTVAWDIVEDVGATDWIGLFLSGKLGYKLAGV